MAVIWGLDLKEMQWGKFKNSYMWNNEYHLRRTKFIVYQLAMIFCVISESLGTAALSGEFISPRPPQSPHHPWVSQYPRKENFLRRLPSLTPHSANRLPIPTRLRAKTPSRRHHPQQRLHRHRLVQHLRRHLRRHHLRLRLLLRPLLARAPRVACCQDLLAHLLRPRLFHDARLCDCIHSNTHAPCCMDYWRAGFKDRSRVGR